MTPESYTLIQNKAFQRWLQATGILTVTPNRPNTAIKEGQRFEPLRQKVYDGLMHQEEFIVSPYFLVDHLIVRWRKQYDQKSFVQRVTEYAANLVSDVRGLLQDPSCIAHWPRFGYSIGVENLRLSGGTGRVLYRLWQDLGLIVPTNVLAKDLFNSDDHYACSSVNSAITRLRHEFLPGTKAAIPFTYKGRGYRLVEIKESQ